MIDLEKFAADKIEQFRRNRDLHKKILACVLIALLGLAGKFIYDLVPRHYDLSLSGGSMLGNRHHLAKILSDEAQTNNLSLKIVPTDGALDALEKVDAGKLDLAFIQSGLDTSFPNVRHVATISPELIHFLVKPNIKGIEDIRGKTVNMGEPEGAERILAKQILDISGLRDGENYVETNYSERDLIGMRPERLPDVIVLVSYTPSDVAEFLVKERGYDLLEMSFPPSLAIRLGWVADATILGYMYSIVPPVPTRDIHVVGVNLHLVANKNIDARSVAKVIETLYGTRVTSRFGHNLSDSTIMLQAGYPVSEGTELYLAQKEPLLTQAAIDKIKTLAGLIMTLVSTLAIAIKWYTAPHEPSEPPESETPQTDPSDSAHSIEENAAPSNPSASPAQGAESPPAKPKSDSEPKKEKSHGAALVDSVGNLAYQVDKLNRG